MVTPGTGRHRASRRSGQLRRTPAGYRPPEESRVKRFAVRSDGEPRQESGASPKRLGFLRVLPSDLTAKRSYSRVAPTLGGRDGRHRASRALRSGSGRWRRWPRSTSRSRRVRSSRSWGPRERQDDAAADRRRPGRAVDRRRGRRRLPRRRPSGQTHRLRARSLRRCCPGARSRPTPACSCDVNRRRTAGARGRRRPSSCSSEVGLGDFLGAYPARAVGRHAAAGGPGAGARPRCAVAADGRAVRRPRRDHPHRHAPPRHRPVRAARRRRSSS